ncbi:MAG: polyhydroxyalkanoate granule-associated phasin [Betaproteobacteria bacterium]
MRRRRVTSAAAPLAAWLGVYWKAMEMSAASAHVIGHRTGRMMLAGRDPGPADRREFAMMGREKVLAAQASSAAIATSLFAFNLQLWSRAVDSQLRTAAAVASLASSRSIGQALARQAKLARTMGEAPLSAGETAAAAARVVARGMAPLHARSTANSRRLAKR